MEEIARLNPCVRFILDNYDMLCIAHPGKVVMTLNSAYPQLMPEAYVAKTFDSMVEAMQYADFIDMSEVPYALKECNGGRPDEMLIISNKCQHRN